MAIIVRTVTIRGIRPFLWNRFGPDILPLEKQPRTGVAGNDPEEWRKGVLMTHSRQLFLKPSYIFGCLREAARYTKKARGTLQSNVGSTLQVLDDRVLLDRRVPKNIEELQGANGEAVYIDVQTVTNPGTRARNVRYRVAASPGWTAAFTSAWDNTIVSDSEMQAVLRDAGQLVGVGDARKIGYGRFDVTDFRAGETGGNAKKTSTRRALAAAAK